MGNEMEQSSVAGELQDLVLESIEIDEFLDGLVKIAARELSAATGSAIYSAVTVLRPKRAATVASSSELAKNMDEVQYSFNDGPCLRAAREHRTIIVQDYETERRFPGYRKAIEQYGIRSTLGVPILLRDDVDAGLDLYCEAPDSFSPEAIQAAESFAASASNTVQLAVRFAGLMDQSKHLSAAMENRTTIDVAVGIVMGQNRCSQEAAVSILTEASSNSNTKLRDIAKSLVDSVGGVGTRTHYQEPGGRQADQTA